MWKFSFWILGLNIRQSTSSSYIRLWLEHTTLFFLTVELSFFSVFLLPLANWSLWKKRRASRCFHAAFSTDRIASRNVFDPFKLNMHLLNTVTGFNSRRKIKNNTTWSLPVRNWFKGNKQTTNVLLKAFNIIITF